MPYSYVLRCFVRFFWIWVFDKMSELSNKMFVIEVTIKYSLLVWKYFPSKYVGQVTEHQTDNSIVPELAPR